MSAHLAGLTVERFDELDRTARAVAVEHAAGCAECRARLLAVDPTRAFVLLAGLPIPPGRLDRFSVDLGREIDRLSGRAAPQPLRTVASIAASIALAVALVGLVGEREGTGIADRAEVGVGATSAEPAYGHVDLLSSPGEAQVLDLRVGGTQVVMIFDKDLAL